MITKITGVSENDTYIVDSDITGRQYRITVSLPLGYSATDDAEWPFHNTPDRWSAIYVLDGNWYAEMIAGMIRPTAWCGGTSDAIVVGIGYTENDDPVKTFQETFTRRDLDLTPIHDATTEKMMTEQHRRPVPNGDATGFLSFIRDELITFIENTYRANADKRILAGHSYGGLFGLFALLKEPKLFESYIVGSPYLSYGERVLFQYESEYADKNADLPATVYMYTTENEEMIDDTTFTDTIRFAVMLQSRTYANLTLMRKIFTEYNHCEVAVPGLYWGLQLALKSN